MFGPAVASPADARSASWIAPRLDEFGTIGGLAPDGFDRYLLVRPTPFTDGGLDEPSLVDDIARVAQGHTTTPQHVWFAIWEGYGWGNSMTLYSVGGEGPYARMLRARARLQARIADRRRHDRVRRGLEQIPAFDLPNRRYHLVQGPLEAARRITQPGSDRTQLPDLWWPNDRRWFVATDTDLDWTVVGGSHAFIEELIAAVPERSASVHRHEHNSQFM
jgi:hypothetical protein